MASTQTIAEHYGRADLGTVILAALNAAGKNIDRLEPDDLAPIDELHSRGREATTDLARLLALKGDETVLDVGCGIGGRCSKMRGIRCGTVATRFSSAKLSSRRRPNLAHLRRARSRIRKLMRMMIG